jgi:hypothetical protein
MSEPLKSEPLLISFFVADAWLERISDVLNDDHFIRAHVGAKRYQLSTGSSRVNILYRQKKAGWIELIAMGEQLTLFEAYATNQPATRTLMTTLSELFYSALVMVTAQSIKHGTHVGVLLTDLQSTIRAAADVLPQEPNEPKPGDPIDAWLDWRDAEQHRTGRRISLTRIATMGNFKLDALKKRSAARHRQNTDDAAH